MNRNEILIWVHPLWTTHLKKNITELDKVISFVNTFEKKLILFPKIDPKFKRTILRSAVLSLHKPNHAAEFLRPEIFNKILSKLNISTTFKLKGTTSRHNSKNNYNLVNKRIKKLTESVLRYKLPIFKGETYLNEDYFKAEKYILEYTFKPAVINYGSSSPFIAGKLKNNNYVLIGEYSNQCVNQVYEILKEKGFNVRIEHQYSICNGCAPFDETKDHLFIEGKKEPIIINKLQ